jgi:raffinose/stachyose/melibiose transport system substrate-binding protein
MSIRTLALASCCFFALAAPAFADTTVTILHVNDNKTAVKIWDQAAADYNAAHKGVKVEFKYLENEAFKAKLPTMLQSEESRPAAFYSWGGGVMDAQAKGGFLKDIKGDTADVVKTLSPTAVDAFTIDGKLYGLPFDTDAVPIFYNKALFAKAGVKPEDMQTWDGFLAGIKKLKAAGVTPIVVGASEKWPMHFWYSYLVMRIGGSHALADAKAGKDGGFKNPTFVEAGKRLQELAALEPFQPGYNSTTHPQSAASFGDGKAAMDLMGSWLIDMQRSFASDGKGQPLSNIGVMPFPTLPGGKGEIGDTLGGVHAFLVSKTAPPETVDFLKFFSQEKYAKEAAEAGAYIPVVTGTEAYIKNPLVKEIAGILAKTKYHQNFFDQDLGPSVGRVINDVSVEVAASRMKPEAAAAAIQEAEEQQ